MKVFLLPGLTHDLQSVKLFCTFIRSMIKINIMKKLTLIILLFSLTHAACFAQAKYSRENLEKSTQDELANYLNEANKLQKSGRTVTIVGGSILVATLPIAAMVGYNDWDAGGAALIVGGVVGIGTLAIGIAMISTNKKRIKLINSIRNSRLHGINIDLRPGVQYNFAAQNYQPGIVLRIRF